MNKFLVLLFAICLVPLNSETIRGNLSGIVNISEAADSPEAQLKLDELAAFQLDLDNPFLKAVELRVEIPRYLQNYRNSFALYLYRDLSPLPQLDENQYRATQVLMHILPTQNFLSIKIPLIDAHGLVRDASSVVSSPVDSQSFPLLLALIPIMKGIPDEAYNWPLNINAIPIFKEQGGLQLNIEASETAGNESLQLFIDGVEHPLSTELYILSSGFHQLSIGNSDVGATEYNIEIVKGEILELSHRAEQRPGMVMLELPPGVLCSIDGENYLTGNYEFNPGIYHLRYEINPSWILEEDFTVHGGEEILLSLKIQSLIEP